MSQHDRLLDLLRSYNGAWVPLPEILKLMISQYGRVINDLRTGKHGQVYKIENKTEWIDGVRHSWFRLVISEPRQVFQDVRGQLAFI